VAATSDFAAVVEWNGRCGEEKRECEHFAVGENEPGAGE